MAEINSNTIIKSESQTLKQNGQLKTSPNISNSNNESSSSSIKTSLSSTLNNLNIDHLSTDDIYKMAREFVKGSIFDF